MSNYEPQRLAYECPICFSNMRGRTPRALSCLHTYCQPCLESMMLQDPHSDYIVCPSCRQTTQLQERGISGLPVNFLIEHLASTGNSEAKRDFCKMCVGKEKSESARNMCLECSMPLCAKCSDIHQEYRVFQNHSVVPLHGSVYCVNHKQRVAYHCRSCDASLCPVCATEEPHVSHAEEVETIVPVEGTNKPSVARYKYLIQSLVRSLGRKAKVMEGEVEELRREIQQRSDAMKERIDDQLKQLMNQLDIASRPTKDICDKMLKAQMDLSQLEEKLNACTSTEEPKASLENIEQKINKSVEFAKELEKKVPPNKLQFLRGYDNFTVGTLVNTPYKIQTKPGKIPPNNSEFQISTKPGKSILPGNPKQDIGLQNKHVPEEILLDEEITVDYLDTLSPVEQKELLGVRLYPKVATRCPALVGKVTGMILELDNDILLYILNNETGLAAMVDKALAVLKEHNINNQNVTT